MTAPTTAIQPVPADQVPAVWSSLQTGLSVVRDKAAADLDADLVFDRLMAQQAFLFLIPEGFFVLLPRHGKRLSVLIWVAYAHGQGMIAKYLPTIETLAIDIGAVQLEFQSDRPGYRRVFRDWTRDGPRYTKRLI